MHASDRLDIRHQMPCGVCLDRRMRPGPATAALVKQDDPVHGWVKIAAHGGATSTPRTAMQNNNSNPVRPPALLDMDPVPIPHFQHALVKGVDGRVKIRDCAFMTRDLVHIPPI